METLCLEKLSEKITAFSVAECDYFSENCIVALENNNHISGCKLSVEGDLTNHFNISWSKKVKQAGYKEPKKIIEHAAETISFFLSSSLTEYSVIEEAIIGTGIDYWLGYNEGHELYDAKNFIQARLEVSGINKETASNSLYKRVKEKKIQSGKSDSIQLPVYVSVVEFSTPRAYFGKK